jgi:glycosyltransferase involved in cell wall biosynthesis
VSVSVVIPVYNGERYLREAVESVYAQTAPPTEVVIVNDGSTDGTAALLDSLRREYPLTVVTQPNAREAAAKNAGVAAAQGELIAFLDHDDTWHPSKLERHLAHFAANPGLGMSFSATQTEALGGWEMDAAFGRLLTGCVVGPPSAVVVRRDALHEFVQIDPYGDDWLMWLELAAKGVWIEYLPERLVDYREHPESLSHASSHTAAGCRVIPLFFERNPSVPGGRYWRARWHFLAAENGDGRMNLLKAAAINPRSVRPGWLRIAVTGRAAWAKRASVSSGGARVATRRRT